MTTALSSPSSSLSAVKVNVALCGSLPREEMDCLSISSCAPPMMTSNFISHQQPPATNSHPSSSTYIEDDVASQVYSQLSKIQRQQQLPNQVPRRTSTGPTFEAPSWAVPASGEARLEPVCDSIDHQAPVDLTDRAVYRIGRGPQSDVKLNHITSSRSHAMLFHHSNGSCYLVDCGSAHGTYVNGVRVSSHPNAGVVVPHRVRRGSLIRFGGAGAPQYVLKSFTFDLEEMKDFTEESQLEGPVSPSSEVVQNNTRFNALGKSAKESLFFNLSSKRSFDSMETMVEDTSRCLSPSFNLDHRMMRLVSPDSFGQPGKKRRRVSFSSAPPMAAYPNLITPDLSSDENDCD